MDLSVFTNTDNLFTLLTLTGMEIILGVDNVIFVSIVTSRLPLHQQAKGRAIGLSLALIIRIILLAFISFLAGMTSEIFAVAGFSFSARDLILLGGGLFLIYKTTMEIYNKLEGENETHNSNVKSVFMAVVFQVIIIDIVFSFDSIITAIGLSKVIEIMIAAVVISMFIMLAFSGVVSKFINRHPSMKMLALSFLLIIGFMLVMEGLHKEIEKGYVYFAMAFSLAVETLNIIMRKKSKPVKLKNNLNP
ncbi:MAG: TerC family protein [Bacteroidota bacterium]|nr:TerC family protein [Bacteroidota bacterium]